jgi:LytS/YehU family sensor histidine kinase
VRLEAARLNGHLRLSVYNDGPQLSADWQNHASGVGLSNLVTRLRSLYGDKFEFRLASRDKRGVEASVSVPYTIGSGAESGER